MTDLSRRSAEWRLIFLPILILSHHTPRLIPLACFKSNHYRELLKWKHEFWISYQLSVLINWHCSPIDKWSCCVGELLILANLANWLCPISVKSKLLDAFNQLLPITNWWTLKNRLNYFSIVKTTVETLLRNSKLGWSKKRRLSFSTLRWHWWFH